MFLKFDLILMWGPIEFWAFQTLWIFAMSNGHLNGNPKVCVPWIKKSPPLIGQLYMAAPIRKKRGELVWSLPLLSRALLKWTVNEMSQTSTDGHKYCLPFSQTCTNALKDCSVLQFFFFFFIDHNDVWKYALSAFPVLCFILILVESWTATLCFFSHLSCSLGLCKSFAV